MLANTVPALLSDETNLRRLMQEDRSLFERIADYIQRFLEDVRQAIATMAGRGGDWQQMDALKGDAQAMQEILDRMLALLEEKSEGTEDTTDSDYMRGNRYSLIEYTEHEKDNWKNTNRIVIYQNDKQLQKFVENAVLNRSYKSKMYFGKVDVKIASAIRKEISRNVDGYNIALSADEVRKILLAHGDDQKEEARGQRVITIDDFEKIREIIQARTV